VPKLELTSDNFSKIWLLVYQEWKVLVQQRKQEMTLLTISSLNNKIKSPLKSFNLKEKMEKLANSLQLKLNLETILAAEKNT